MLLIILYFFSFASAASFTCPSAGILPSQFHGSAGDSIGQYFCILSTFVDPNSQSRVFITIGNAANSAADQDVTCALLDTAHAPSVLFNVSDPSGQSCPIATGLPFASWRSGSGAAVPACPPGSAPLPPGLEGVGRLTDAAQSGTSRLHVGGSSWTTVEQGSLVSVQCVAAVSSPGAAAGVTQLLLSNALAPGQQQGCVWVQPSPPGHLRYKLGAGGACPVDFSRPTSIPFNFTAASPAAAAAPAAPPAFVQPDFVISFWVDPIVPPSAFPQEYARLAGANYTAVMGGFGATDAASVQAQVAACAAAGLQCIPTSCETAASPGAPGSCIGIGANESTLLGYQLWDEPQASDFPAVAAWMASVAARTAPRALLRFVNLLPNYADFPGTYEDYLQAFVDAAHPDLLSFDHYPLFPGSAGGPAPTGNVSMQGYRLNLASVRAVAQGAGIGFWNFLNAMPFNGRPDVTEAQLRWQVFTSIAYGAKGVLYFCYWSPTGQANGFQWGNAIMTPRALPGQEPVYSQGPHFAQVARVNAKALPLGRLLLRAASTSVQALSGNGSTLAPTGSGSPIAAVAAAIPGLAFSVLLGGFAGAWSSAGGGGLTQAVVLVNQDVDFPLLLRLQMAQGAQPYEASSDGLLREAWNDAPAAPGFSISLEAGDARVLFF